VNDTSYHPELSTPDTLDDDDELSDSDMARLFSRGEGDPYSVDNVIAFDEGLVNETTIYEGEEYYGTRKLTPMGNMNDMDDMDDHHDHHHMDLFPLQCNEGITFDCTSTPLSSLSVPASGPLVIECGTCVYVDTSNGNQLNLPYGLRIDGKLYFPPESSITIRTIYVMVVGILKMDTPLLGNEVKFSLYGEQDSFYFADPTKTNGMTTACESGCKIGKKAIAVMGGKLFRIMIEIQQANDVYLTLAFMITSNQANLISKGLIHPVLLGKIWSISRRQRQMRRAFPPP
jgi:hypothetical protein